MPLFIPELLILTRSAWIHPTGARDSTQTFYSHSALTPRKCDPVLAPASSALLTLLYIIDACEAMGINEVVESKSEW